MISKLPAFAPLAALFVFTLGVQAATPASGYTGTAQTSDVPAGVASLTWRSSIATVSTDAELRAAILAAEDGDTITFANDITLTGDLPAVQKNITIDGAGHALDGANTYRGLFFAAWAPGTATFIPMTATVRNLTITHAVAKGGAGGYGGGGAGLGGAIFVASFARVNLERVSCAHNQAVGGSTNGGPGFIYGGGGMGGDGAQTLFGGGGGLGIGANGSASGAGASGIATGAAAGGSASGNPGGNNGGGGAASVGTAGGGGGGVGGSAGSEIDRSGGAGGFGGGGGAGAGPASAGGFGGGGGAAPTGGTRGAGAGGFGGGGCAGPTGTPGQGGFGGGVGAPFSGGGGAGMGGAIFVMEGGSLTLTGSLTINGNTVAGGTGANSGSAFGSGIFAQGDNALTFSPGVDEVQTISGVVADQTGSGGTGVLSLTKNGPGILVLAPDGIGTPNAYSGTTTIAEGAVYLGFGASTGTGPVLLQNGGELVPGSNNTLGSLTWDGGGTLGAQVGSAAATMTISRAFAKGTPGSYMVRLWFVSNGVIGIEPGRTYRLLTFGSNVGFVQSDFTVANGPIANGALVLTSNSLDFVVPPDPIPSTYGVGLRVAKGKNRATFTIQNTGNTTTGFALRRSNKVTNTYSGPSPRPSPGRKSALVFTYELNGRNITSALDAQRASVTLAAGGTAQVVVKVRVRGGTTLRFKRIIDATIRAFSEVDPSKTGSAKARFVLKPAAE